jgi:hypothetical protein
MNENELRDKIREALESGPKSTLELYEVTQTFRMYSVARAMHNEGILRTWTEEGGVERGGRPRRFYALYYTKS